MTRPCSNFCRSTEKDKEWNERAVGVYLKLFKVLYINNFERYHISIEGPWEYIPSSHFLTLSMTKRSRIVWLTFEVSRTHVPLTKGCFERQGTLTVSVCKQHYY